MRAAFWLGVVIVSSLIFLLCSQSHDSSARRIAFGGGIVATAVVVLHGIVWPNVNTIVAALAVPCQIMFVIGLLRPRVMESRWLRVYGTIIVVLGVSTVSIQQGSLLP